MTTAEQSRASLAIAEEVRLEQAAYRRALTAEGVPQSRATARALIAMPPRSLQRVEIERFLTWLPRIGRAYAWRLLVKANVRSNRRLGELTLRERQAVRDVLGGGA